MKAPSELENALARIETSKKDYIFLNQEIYNFLYEYVKGMIKERDRETGNFVIQLRHPKDSILPSQLKILTGQIIENLRSALDYMIFELSVKNHPHLNKRSPQFVIADSKSAFKRELSRGLRYLTDEQKGFVEKIQPYHGNKLLGLLRDATNIDKHRKLLELRDNTGLEIYLDELANKESYKGAWMYPQEDGAAFFAKPKSSNGLRIVLMNKYDAIETLRLMIIHILEIVQASYKYFYEQ